MKKLIVLPFCFLNLILWSQVKWSMRASFKDIEWDNYSTSFLDPGKHVAPVIVTAIPYNGIYSNFDDINAELDMSFDSSLFRFRSNFSDMSRKLYTYDSSEVYFLVPGIYRSNAKEYQYRLLLNGDSIIQSWQDIIHFADSSFALNNFKRGMAFLGGYKTTWNNYLLLELKRKDSDTLLSAAVIYWKQVKPVLLDIYTTDELNSFLARLKKPYDHSITKEELNKWKEGYSPAAIDSTTGLPRKLLLKSGQNNIIFYLRGDIYKKEALEYQLKKDGEVYIPWRSNDFDNNFIWLKNLKPGEYELQMRFRSQRHNVKNYPFSIQHEWFQSTPFKVGILALTLFIVVLLYWLWKQRQKTKSETIKKEKLNLELKALRSQLNPHFVFNALSSIQGLVNKNELVTANHYLTEFSSLLRESLKNKDAEYVALAKEIKILETYITLEQLRFHFQYRISIEGEFPLDNIEIPSLLVQPLVENAIKHGAGPKYENGLLELSFSVSGKNLLIDIEDNGSGFDTGKVNQGFGLKLVTDRIQLLNSSLNDQRIQIRFDSDRNASTIVHLNFENWL